HENQNNYCTLPPRPHFARYAVGNVLKQESRSSSAAFFHAVRSRELVATGRSLYRRTNRRRASNADARGQIADSESDNLKAEGISDGRLRIILQCVCFLSRGAGNGFK